MLTIQTRDCTGAEGEAATGIAFAMIFDIVEGVYCWCGLGGEGQDEGFAVLGGDAVVSEEQG